MRGLSKIIGGLLGFLLAGWGGFVLGVFIGHIFDKNLELSTSDRPKLNPSSETATPKQTDEEKCYADTVPPKVKKAYQVLGVTQGATPAEIKYAYRQFIGRYHPDRLAQQKLSPRQLQAAYKKMQRIKEAYHIICNTKNFY
jgi:DnaJ-domain-containing protein 1